MSTHPGTSITSKAIKSMYPSHAVACHDFIGALSMESCEALANMCVLSNYDDGAAPCKLLSSVALLRSVQVNHGGITNPGWFEGVPWIGYGASEDGDAILSDTNLDVAVSSNTRLAVKIASRSLNGTWLGMKALGSELLYCGAVSRCVWLGAPMLMWFDKISPTCVCMIGMRFYVA